MTVQALRERRIGTLAGLLDAYGREIQGVAYLILRDRALTEDVAIETCSPRSSWTALSILVPSS